MDLHLPQRHAVLAGAKLQIEIGEYWAHRRRGRYYIVEVAELAVVHTERVFQIRFGFTACVAKWILQKYNLKKLNRVLIADEIVGSFVAWIC